MFTAYVVVTLLTIAADAFSGVAALVHFKPIIPGMLKAGVPESWLIFPIGTLKTAGAIGLLLGLIGVPLIGRAGAIGLVLFFATTRPDEASTSARAAVFSKRNPIAKLNCGEESRASRWVWLAQKGI